MEKLAMIISVTIATVSLSLTVYYSINIKTNNLETIIADHSISNTKKNIVVNFIIRIMDLFFSIFGILSIMPMFLMIYLALKINNPSSAAISKIKAIGKNGKVVYLYSFITDELAESISFLKVLHNLPRFFNLFKGDISLFGLSVITQNNLEMIKQEIPDILSPYFLCKPGLVSLSSLKSYDNNVSYYKFIHLTNIEFANNRGLKLFLRMLKGVFFTTLKPIE